MNDNRRMEKLVTNVPVILESKVSKGRVNPMSTKRIWAWTGRLLALLAAVIIPACGNTGSPGGANPNGILWNSQGTGAPTGGAPGGTSLWVDPNSGLGASTIGISNIITSADDATYDAYYASGGTGLNGSKITYIFGNLHPLSTDTGSNAITSRENTLQGQINGYRQQQLGNVGAGGGGGGLGGGVAVGNTVGIILAGHFKGTKSARAHCKYWALGFGTGPFAPGPNTEGDNMQTTLVGSAADTFGTPAPGNPDGKMGRLGKIGVVAYVPSFAVADMCLSGAQYGEANAVFSQLLITYPGALAAMGPTNFAVGHWRGGTAAYYWDILFLLNPVPAN